MSAMVGIRIGDVIKLEDTNYLVANEETTGKGGLIVELKNLTGDDQPKTIRLVFGNNRATNRRLRVGEVSRSVLEK